MPLLSLRGRVARIARAMLRATTLVVIASCVDARVPTQLASMRVVPPDTVTRGTDTTTSPPDTAASVPDTVNTAAPSSPNDEARVAELPRRSVAITYPRIERDVHVAAGADLQAAIDDARPGDALLLAPGATYEGNFVLRNKGESDSWIVIRTDVDDITLGAAGARMTPSVARAARLATIVSPSSRAALMTELGANHYRLVGVEVTAREAVGDVNAIIRFGDASSAQNSVASIAHDLIIDRSYVHGTPVLQVRRCLMLNSATSAVIDSWLGECHSNVSDSQAIVGWNGPGPYLIQNNHLEAGHEVLVFGGGTSTIADQSPSDVTVRGNHVTRPLAWKGVWQVKNLLETKHVRRLLVEGNVFENNWADAQAGFAFVLKSENQNSDTPWTQSTDITIRYNRIRNTGNGFNLAANPSGLPARPAARIVIADNIIQNVNVGPYNGDGHTFQLLGALADVVLTHNTITSVGGQNAFALLLGSLPVAERLVVHSNVMMHGGYGIKGGGTAEGMPSLEHYAPGASVRGNLIVGGGNPAAYPAGNFFFATLADAGFTQVAAGDYRLDASSGAALATDGAIVGADVDRVDAETRGAVVDP
ncbi:MAG: hypothetical protein ABI601_00620 [bacterium]